MFVVKNVSLFLAFFCLFSLDWMVNVGAQVGPFPKRAKFSGQDLNPQFCGIRAREQYEWLQIVKCGSLSGSTRSQCLSAVAPIYSQLQNACQTYDYKYNMYVSRQTPINILGVQDQDLPAVPSMNPGDYDTFFRSPLNYAATPGTFFQINYLDQPIEGYQSGYKFKVNKWVGPYTVNYNGATYELAGWHFHRPSEHTFDGVTYPMEIHFVHVMTSAPYLGLQRDQDKYLVLGFMMDDFSADPANSNTACAGYVGPFDGLLTQPVSSTTVTITTEMVSRIFTYEGGLTTPPFTARVRWMLSAYPIQTDINLINLWGTQDINPDYKDKVWINEAGNVPWLTGDKVLQWKQFGHYPLSTRTAFPDRPPVRELYQDVLLVYTSTSLPNNQYTSWGCPNQ
jgi:carbonic anhydrase